MRLNGRLCETCGAPLVGRQLRFCSERCKQTNKNRARANELVTLREDNKKLRRQVKSLQTQVKNLKAAS